jgi:hypothetical protein
MARELLIMGRTRNLRDVESNKEEKASTWRDWTFVLLWSVVGYTCIILTVLTYFNPGLIPFDISSILFRKELSPFFAFSQGPGHYPKPEGFKIVALVPFHYHERTAILDCYLQVRHIHRIPLQVHPNIVLEKSGSKQWIPRPGRLRAAD